LVTTRGAKTQLETQSRNDRKIVDEKSRRHHKRPDNFKQERGKQKKEATGR